IFSSVLLSACGKGDIDDLLGRNNHTEQQKIQTKSESVSERNTVDSSGNYAGNVVIDLLADSPKVSQQTDGLKLTNVVLQFIPRDANGFPLASEQIDVEMEVNGKAIDIESHLESTADELQFNVNFGLVLDTSYSMVERNALTPMLEAAQQSVQSGVDIWKEKPGTFNFYTSWFNNYIFYSVDSALTNWTPQDISTIPTPEQRSFTKLYSAIDFMINKLDALPRSETSSIAPADQNIILVFSDGEDNYSFNDNSGSENTSTNYTDLGAEYTKTGYKKTTLPDLINKLEASNNLTVHVIGLGDTINETNLQKIVNSGNGTFRKNPDSDDLLTVFDGAVQEFTTLQTHGAALPLPPGNHTFTLRVKNKSGNLFAEHTFAFTTDGETASILTK
ncbi:MAG: VWA domain-containing protein, partial [Gammaproteobacteria bacterium]|nr:VWA domain-containing protein [Gammaproteobacteria bacterium]